MHRDTVNKPSPGHMHRSQIIVGFTIFGQLWRIPLAIPPVTARQILGNILCHLKNELGRICVGEGGGERAGIELKNVLRHFF